MLCLNRERLFYTAILALCRVIADNVDLPSSSMNRSLSQEDTIVWEGKIPVKGSEKLQHFHFIHIPKNGGSSFLNDSIKHMPVGSIMKGNRERSIYHTFGDRKDMVVFLRDPSKHVLSQFLECKYDKFFEKHINNTGFPGRNAYKDALIGFDRWIEHFALKKNSFGYKGAYYCYNPWNMQARFLSLDNLNVHIAESEDDLEPPLTVAIQNLESIGTIGITDHYDASVCLFEYKALGYFLPDCECNEQTNQLRIAELGHTVHITHGVPPHSIDDVKNDTLFAIQEMTKIDEKLYNHALTMFYDEIEIVANETGVDLLCGF